MTRLNIIWILLFLSVGLVMSCGSEEPSNDASMDTAPSSATATENPMTENPMIEDPVTEDPVTENPVTQDPITEDPVTENPVIEDPATDTPSVSDTPSVPMPPSITPPPPPSPPTISEPTPSVPTPTTPPTKVQALSDASVLGQHNGFSEQHSGICVDPLLSGAGLGPRHALTFDDGATAFYWSVGDNWEGFPTPWYPGLSQEHVSSCQVLDFDRTAANRICIEAWATAEGECASCSNAPQTESELDTVAKQCAKCPSSCVEANGDGCSATAVCNSCVNNGSLSKIYVFADDGDNVISDGKLVGDINIDADSEGTVVCAEFGDAASGTDFEQVQQIAVCRGGCGGDSYNLAVDYVYLEVDAE